MKPFYWESEIGNFGDDLNLWLWDFLLPGFRDIHEETMLVGVGTVLNKVLLPQGVHKLVIGSGFGYGALPDMETAGEWDIRCVRGPLTAAKVGIEPHLGIVDPAVLVSEMPEFQSVAKTGGTCFVPHWESATAGIWPAVCKSVGLGYIDPRGEAKSVIRQIAQSELIIAESMHGAILADAFRVPWIAVSTSKAINSFKWNDWAQTVGVTYAPRRVPVSTRAEAMMKGSRFWGVDFDAKEPALDDPNKRHFDETIVRQSRAPRQTSLRTLAKQVMAVPSAAALWQASRAEPQLSDDAVLARRKDQFMTVIAEIRRDYF